MHLTFKILITITVKFRNYTVRPLLAITRNNATHCKLAALSSPLANQFNRMRSKSSKKKRSENSNSNLTCNFLGKIHFKTEVPYSTTYLMKLTRILKLFELLKNFAQLLTCYWAIDFTHSQLRLVKATHRSP